MVDRFEPYQIHRLAKTNTVNQKDINRIPTRLKLATGNLVRDSSVV